jgi:hypothetical protein
MTEFKFACPVCGQRMAVDASASGAQVECPTCFQIIIVPKAPAEGSKYQLSATQFLKPVFLPPPKKPAAPVAPQRKYAVLIFALILVCAASLALLIREKIVQSQQEQAKAASTNAVSFAVSPLWTLDLTNAVFPDEPAAGKIHGKDFVCRRVFFQNGLLTLRSSWDRDSEMTADIFFSTNNFSTNAAELLSGRSFEAGTNRAGFVPGAWLSWHDGDLQVRERFTNGLAMKLEFGAVSSNGLPGRIYLCLPDEEKSYIAGKFTAEIRNSRPRR